MKYWTSWVSSVQKNDFSVYMHLQISRRILLFSWK